ncbi:hypothetical protein OTK49_01385 [Vibrio coralliirubri]|uniref:hypothetical protein n=1 Tax=Vibrio coralliirubri TaxID=1516159 RepID=UPI0022845EE8|nr:hypothetical protein [Vibrio coralliirubri]MCY9861181.1 hypothetical protein [Vibrio coralliirubri]
MSIIAHMNYFQNHHAAYSEVLAMLEQIKEDYKTDSNENIAKVVFNMLSEETASFYTAEFLLDAFNFGFYRIPIAVAIKDTEQLIEGAYAKWSEFSWMSKLIMGSAPNRKGAANWLLATHFNSKSIKAYSALSEVEQEILKLIYGNILSISSKKG